MPIQPGLWGLSWSVWGTMPINSAPVWCLTSKKEAMAPHSSMIFWMIDLLEMTIFQFVKCSNCFPHFRGSMSILPYIAKSWRFPAILDTDCYDWSHHVMSRGHMRQIFTKHLRSVQNFVGGLVDYCLMQVDSHLSFWRNPHLKALKDHALYLSGWWLSHPSEKYEHLSGWLFPIYWKIKTCSKPPTSYAFVDSPSPFFDGSINRLAINHRKETGKLPTLRISRYIKPHVLWFYQWEFQDPKMEVLCHIRPYFGGISPYIALT